MVSESQKALITSTWAAADHTKVGLAFYSNLQSRCPDVYAVFGLGGDAGKTSVQASKVIAFVNEAVNGLGDMGAVKAKVDALGARHTKYGATKAHFGSAKSCFVDAVGASGDAKGAWEAMYDVIADGVCAHL